MYRQHLIPPRGVRSATATPHIVTISLLGGFQVVVDGHLTDAAGWSRRSAAALVKILALAPGHQLHRERVLDLLWPDDPIERSAPRLHKAAHFARRAAGSELAVVLRDDIVSLFPGAELTVDVVKFEQLARRAAAAEDAELARQALTWYDGELLPADRYEEWAADRRELLHLRRLDMLRIAGDWRELAEADPTDEHAHVQLMRAHLADGAHSAAVRQFERLERVLDRELGASPGDAALLVRQEAFQTRPRRHDGVDDLLATLADLQSQHRKVVAELAAVGALEHPSVRALIPM